MGKSVLLLPEIVNAVMKESNQDQSKKVQVDPFHTYCRRFEEPEIQIVQVKSLKKGASNKSKSIPVNAEKYHNYFSKKENIENSSISISDEWTINDVDFSEPK